MGAFSMGLRRWRAGFGDVCGWVEGDVLVGGDWHSLKGLFRSTHVDEGWRGASLAMLSRR